MAFSVIQHLEILYRKMCDTGAVFLEFQLGPNEKLKLVRQSSLLASSSKPPSALHHLHSSSEEIPSALKIAAPLSGVFYRAPAPSAPSFVEEGSQVRKGDVLCIIEAMKVLNEIKAPRDGRMASIRGINGKHVKKGDVLFLYAD